MWWAPRENLLPHKNRFYTRCAGFENAVLFTKEKTTSRKWRPHDRCGFSVRTDHREKPRITFAQRAKPNEILLLFSLAAAVTQNNPRTHARFYFCLCVYTRKRTHTHTHTPRTSCLLNAHAAVLALFPGELVL